MLNSRSIDRSSRHIALLALCLAAVTGALLYASCGPVRDDCSCQTSGAKATTITNNHSHALTIPASDFEAFADRNYPIKGTADHDHVVAYTSQQFQVVSNGSAATATSTATQGHTHDVTIGCACK